jgi:CheY-like chemotaxis protein
MLALVLRRSWGDEVHVAHDGPTALRMIEEHRADVIVLDIGLPGMSGFEVARVARERSNATTIAMTGYVREQGSDEDFDDYLIKPVDLSELLMILAELT